MRYRFSVFGNSMFRMIVVYLLVNLIMLINITNFNSATLGFVVSVIYAYISSVLCGNIFFKDEVSWHRVMLGFSVFITLLAAGGSVALIFYRLPTYVIVLLLLSISIVLVVLNLKQYGIKAVFNDARILRDEISGDEERKKRLALLSVEHIAEVAYVILAGVSFFFLIASRSEEVAVIWDVVHPAFLPSYFVATSALLIVLLSKASRRTKIFFVIVHSFLISSLTIFVFNPGVAGDPWHELGRAREIYIYGKYTSNLVDLLFGGQSYSPFYLIYFAFRKRVYQALLVIFANMFRVDIYWINILITPVLSATIIPFCMYRIAEILGGKKNCPIFGALLTFSIPMLIWYSAIPVPESLSNVFFCLTVYLTLRYLSSNKTKTSLLMLTFLVIFVTFSTHFKTGIVSFTIFFLALTFKQYKNLKRQHAAVARIGLVLSILVSCALLPIGLLGLHGVYPQAGEALVRFDVEKLLATDVLSLLFGEYVNFSFRELLPSVMVLLAGIMGGVYVMISASKRRFERSLSVFLLLLLVVLVVDYRVLKYAMVVPFSPERIWVLRDLVIIPFAAIMISFLLEEMYAKVRVASGKIYKYGLPRLVAIALVFCLVFSGYVVLAAERAYITRLEILHVTPYDVEAIQYMHRNTPGKYAVISDSILATTAYGLLGFQSRATYYRYSPEFSQMLSNPSVEPLTKVMIESGSSKAYFVISNRYRVFEDVVTRTKKVLETYAVLGDGRLYIFQLAEPEQTNVVPVEIDAGNYSRVDYPIEFKMNFTQVLPKLGEGNLDPNSISVSDTDGKELPSEFDGFQAWFDNCSSVDNWSYARALGAESDGDILTFTFLLSSESPENVGKLVYTRFEGEGGDLQIDTQRYKFIEMKLRGSHDGIVGLRTALRYRVGNASELKVKWISPSPSTEWSVWHCDLSVFNGTLYDLWIDVFGPIVEDWEGDYKLYIDWIRFVSDTGTLRFLYSAEAHTVEQYYILYDFLENTESGKRDGLPKKSYSIPNTNTDESDAPRVYISTPIELTVRTVDSFDEPLSDVTVEIRELKLKANTDADGWAHFVVRPGQWTLVASKNGIVNEKTIEVLPNYVTMQRLGLVEVGGVVMNLWQFALFIGLIMLCCSLLIFLLYRKVLIHVMVAN